MPGVGSLPDDSVGLAVINQASVEAFLLGANYEFARELAWREYPADLAGTWLRTFWDSGGAAEDIPPVADWTHGALGTHAETDPGQVLVLVVKGDLLRRYPNTLVTAVPAHWVEGAKPQLREEDHKGTPLAPIFTGSLGSRRRLSRVRVRPAPGRGGGSRRSAGSSRSRRRAARLVLRLRAAADRAGLRPRHRRVRRVAGARVLEGPHLGRRARVADRHARRPGRARVEEARLRRPGRKHLGGDLGRERGRHGSDHPPAPGAHARARRPDARAGEAAGGA